MSAFNVRDVRVDVVMRTGNRDSALLARAINSVAAQSAGCIRLILVMHGPTELDPVRRSLGTRLQSLQPVAAPDANRAQAMAAGLALVEAPYFALLDDDDYWLENHLANLLTSVAQAGPDPVFAYSDIMRLQEGGKEQSLDIWREGPAAPPLGRITDRISVHSFLADLRALQPLSPQDWNLETAEDALLVASLLASSQPVHVPGATAVYSMGRGDGSAYLRHPNRARDELIFAREVAPHLSRILRRFGAEAPGAQAFLAPFLAAEAAARLALRLSDSEEPVASRASEVVMPLAEDLSLVSEPLAGALEPADAGTVERLDKRVQITLGAAYAYAARLDLEGAAATYPCRLVLDLEPHDAPALVLLVDAAGSVLTEAAAPQAPVRHELQLDLPSTAQALVVRAAPGGAGGHLTVGAMRLAYPLDVLGGSRTTAIAQLQRRGGRRRIGQSSAPGAIHPLISESVQVVLEAPWAYAWSAVLPPQTGHVALSLSTSGVGCGVLFVDEQWVQIGPRATVAEGAAGAEGILAAPEGAARIVLQAGAAPGSRTVVVAWAHALS